MARLDFTKFSYHLSFVPLTATKCVAAKRCLMVEIIP